MPENALIHTKDTLVIGICPQIHTRYPLTPSKKQANKQKSQQQEQINEPLI